MVAIKTFNESEDKNLGEFANKSSGFLVPQCYERINSMLSWIQYSSNELSSQAAWKETSFQ